MQNFVKEVNETKLNTSAFYQQENSITYEAFYLIAQTTKNTKTAHKNI